MNNNYINKDHTYPTPTITTVIFCVIHTLGQIVFQTSVAYLIRQTDLLSAPNIIQLVSDKYVFLYSSASCNISNLKATYSPSFRLFFVLSGALVGTQYYVAKCIQSVK
jgi:hypothetical protein